MKNSKIILAVFTFLVLSLACSGGNYKDYSDISDTVLRWRGVPVQEAFRNPDLLMRLLSDEDDNRSVSDVEDQVYEAESDFNVYVKKVKLDGVSTMRQAYEWVSENIKYNIEKKNVIQANEEIIADGTAMCLGMSQVLAGAILSLGENARLMTGKARWKDVIFEHAWVQIYDQDGNMIAFLDTTPMMELEIHGKNTDEIIRQIPSHLEYRPAISMDGRNIWLH